MIWQKGLTLYSYKDIEWMALSDQAKNELHDQNAHHSN